MRAFGTYLHERRRGIAAFLLSCAVFSGAFALYRLPLAAVAYPALLCAGCGLVFLVLDFLAVRRRRALLKRLAARTEAIASELPAPESGLEEDYQAVVQALLDEAAARSEEGETRYREMVDYYTLWAHQIKTPIASMRLTLQNEDTPASRRISRDLLRVEHYVEMVLAFLRLDAASTDYVFREQWLEPIVRKSARRFSEEFIARRLKLDCAPIGAVAVTDEKWLGFVLEQLISNALKYTREGGVSISFRAPSSLLISDTGAGIAPEDLPRVFEKGFTGNMGREDRRASGLGLYLCKRICTNLGAEIRIDSKPGEGTTVCVDLGEERVTKL